MYAVAMDLDFLEDVATNSTSLRALHNLRRVGMLMDRGYDDGVSDSGSNIRYTAAERYKYLKSLK